MDLDAGHPVETREGRGVEVLQGLARLANQDDLALEGLGPDLAPQHPVVRQPRERPRAATEVDQDFGGGGQGRDDQPRPRGDPVERGVEPGERPLADTDTQRHAPDQTVGVIEHIDRPNVGRALPDRR